MLKALADGAPVPRLNWVRSLATWLRVSQSVNVSLAQEVVIVGESLGLLVKPTFVLAI